MKTIAFIDGGAVRPNVVGKQITIPENMKFDWGQFHAWLKSLPGELYDCHYYDALPDRPSQGLISFHNYLKSTLNLQTHFTSLHTKRKSCPECGQTYCVDEQKGVDVSIVVDMLQLAPYYEQAFLITGDGDFSPAIEHLRKRLARRIVVIGWERTTAPALRDTANETIFMDNFVSDFIS